ncbi:MAG: hypothetical protein JTJ17_02155 [Streptococcus gordonii]|nr:hypothetical protein [Streptococcus gordonii]
MHLPALASQADLSGTKQLTHRRIKRRKKTKSTLSPNNLVQINIIKSIDKTEEWLVERLAKDAYTDILNIFISEYESGT